MSNKGFTIIELTAIIVVLAAIFLVSFPTFLNMTKSDENQRYESMVDDLCLAGESYIYAHIDDFSELSVVNSDITIPIKELIEYGSVKDNLKNPKTDKLVKNDELIYKVLSNRELDCKYKD